MEGRMKNTPSPPQDGCGLYMGSQQNLKIVVTQKKSVMLFSNNTEIIFIKGLFSPLYLV